MIKRTITYTSEFDDKQYTEVAHFHLTKVETIRMEVSKKEGMEKHLKKLVDTDDRKGLFEFIEDLLHKSYGERTDDGRFVKDSEKTKAFVTSEAYDELMMSLITNADEAVAFINGIFPKGLEELAAKVEARTQADQAVTNGGPVVTEPRVLSRAEATEMSHEELSSGLAEGRYKLS